jgi:hypothetical protein
MPNPDRGPMIQIPCSCKGRNQRCGYCDGEGVRTVRGCLRCKGTGTEGGRKCVDCRGDKWRDLDNMDLTI